LFISANRDARMYDAYLQYLNGWRSQGGQLFANFSLAGGYSKWGSWGVLEYISQPAAPKFDALLQFISTNPCWWPDCVVTQRGAIFSDGFEQGDTSAWSGTAP